MELSEAFGRTLRLLRHHKGKTQEDFSLVSSRTYVSLLERGGTIPTLEKIENLCSVLEIHPVTLVAACYLRKEGRNSIRTLLEEVEAELLLLTPDSRAQSEKPSEEGSLE